MCLLSVACVAILLLLLILLPNAWWVSTLIIIFIITAGEMAVLYGMIATPHSITIPPYRLRSCLICPFVIVSAYLPEIAIEEVDRSRVSARAIIWGNAAQVTLAIIIALSISYFTSNNLVIDESSYEDGGNSWRLEWDGASAAIANTTIALNGIVSNIVNSHGHDGSHSLYLMVPSVVSSIAPVILTQINTQPTSYYRDQSILLTSYVEWCRSCSTPASVSTTSSAQIQFMYDNDPTKICSSDVYTLYDGVDQALRVTCIPPSDVTSLTIQLVVHGDGSYWVDYWQAIPPIDLVRPLSLSLTGLWYFIFSLAAWKYLPSRPASMHPKPGQSVWGASMKQLWNSIKDSKKYPGMYFPV
jgi:MFS family permease